MLSYVFKEICKVYSADKHINGIDKQFSDTAISYNTTL